MKISDVAPVVTPGIALAGFVGGILGWALVSWQLARLKRRS